MKKETGDLKFSIFISIILALWFYFGIIMVKSPSISSKLLGIFFIFTILLLVINKFFGDHLINFFNKIESAKLFKYLFSKNKETGNNKISLIIGKVFRPIFIVSIGIIIYKIIPSISDTPLLYLTLSQIFKYALGLLGISAITIWLFKTPDEDGYSIWSTFFYLIIGIAFLIWFFIDLL